MSRPNCRYAFTLVEMIVVIAIILAIAALAAAFLPRVNDSQNLTRAVDNLQQWLLTARMRAKRDGMATGIRFVQSAGDAPGCYSQCQYIQQPDPISGGICVGAPSALYPLAYAYTYLDPVTGLPVTSFYNGGLLTSAGFLPDAKTPAAGQVNFAGVDFTLGSLPPNQWLVQPGDFLEIRDGAVYQIASALNLATLQLSGSAYDSALKIATPTTNYRILRQPRLLIGEEPLTLPNNYAVNFNPIPGVLPATAGSNVAIATSGYPEILFAPSGAVIGANAGNATIVVSVWDTTMNTPDPNRVGVVGIQSRSGFMGAYGISQSGNPFLLVQTARESGL